MPQMALFRSCSFQTTALQVDLVSGQGLGEVFSQYGPFDAVINSAALSQPGATYGAVIAAASAAAAAAVAVFGL